MNRRQFFTATAAGLGATLALGAAAAEPKPIAARPKRIKLAIASYSYWHFKTDKVSIETVIEKAAEIELLRTAALRSDALLVPHHGSRTSSTGEFLAAVRPRFALAAAGYRNRFGHPHEEVLGRYSSSGIELLRTDRDGALTVRLAPAAIGVEAERARRARYWHVPPRPA